METNTRPATQRMTALFCLLPWLLLLSGCANSERTWSAKAESPDQKFVATAQTLRPGGWGTASPPETTVDLNWTTGSQNSTEILTFVGDPDEPEMSVQMKWLTPTHLDLGYKGHPTIEFQAVKCHGVDVTIRELAVAAEKQPAGNQ